MMYWMDWGVNLKVEKVEMDGLGRRFIVMVNLVWLNGFILDQVINCLFWVDVKLDIIEMFDLDGGN